MVMRVGPDPFKRTFITWFNVNGLHPQRPRDHGFRLLFDTVSTECSRISKCSEPRPDGETSN